MNEIEEWATAFRDEHENEIEQTIHQTYNQIRNEAVDLFEHPKIPQYANVHRLIAAMTYLRTCLQSVQAKDIKWYKDYLVVCIKHVYGIIDYPDKHAYTKFFRDNNKTRKETLNNIKGDLLKRLSKY